MLEHVQLRSSPRKTGKTIVLLKQALNKGIFDCRLHVTTMDFHILWCETHCLAQ